MITQLVVKIRYFSKSSWPYHLATMLSSDVVSIVDVIIISLHVNKCHSVTESVGAFATIAVVVNPVLLL